MIIILIQTLQILFTSVMWSQRDLIKSTPERPISRVVSEKGDVCLTQAYRH